ncbi:MAG: hypothetical protein P8Y97_22285, partial [Candidatus Lokiarchaeota archaeon]
MEDPSLINTIIGLRLGFLCPSTLIKTIGAIFLPDIDFWAESMVSAIAGHPGAYYTTATGGDLGHQYTADIMVSPPNYNRMLGLGNSLLNFFDTIGTAFSFGLIPDTMFGLRFDSHNLNYHMATSELYSYNDEKNYFYTEDPSLLDRMYSPLDSYPDPLSTDTSYSSYSSNSYSPYSTSTTGGYTEYMSGPESAKALLQLNDRYNYRSNSLGGAIYRVIKASDNNLTTITPRIGIDSYGDYYPYYQFTAGSSKYAENTYLSHVLYEPLVVSSERYSYLYNNGLTEGYIVTKVQDPSISTIKTQGIDPCKCDQLSPKLLAAAAEQGYDLDGNIPLQKLPLSDLFGGFNYPVEKITLYGFVDGKKVDKKVTLYSESDSDYSIESNAISMYTASDLQAGNINKGVFFEKNLYLTEGIEDILPLAKTSGKEKYYMVEIKVHTIVSDLNYDEEMTKDALSQSTSYAIMDYFDQFQYAQSTAMMTAEIGYTGLLTLTSTLLSTPLIVLGAELTGVAQQESNSIASQVTNAIMKTAVKEAENAAQKSIQLIAMKAAISAVTQSISEVFEEIFIDSIIEGASQNLVRSLGGSSDLGYWLGNLLTTARETKGFSELINAPDS